jgi:hypothetical protein
LSSLNHFTVPVAMSCTSTAYVHCVRGGAARQQQRAPNTAMPNPRFGLMRSL